MEITNLGVLNLINDISGFSYEGHEVKGIINEKISLKVKYHIRALFKELSEYKERFVEIYREWVEKNGEEDFQKFLIDNQDLALTKVEVKDCPVTIDDLDFESEYHYPFFISFVIDKEG
jgi:glutathione peroxidase-family protein